MSPPAVEVTQTSWSPTGEMERHEWQIEGRRLSALSKASAWWVGDWLAFGADRWGAAEQWGETYSEARKLTGYDGKTLRNRRYVSNAVPRAVRVAALTWSHHALVAGLDDRGEQVSWLRRAVDERLSVDDLRIELRASERGRYRRHDDEPEPTESPLLVTCPTCGAQVPVPATLSPAHAQQATLTAGRDQAALPASTMRPEVANGQSKDY